MDIEAPSPYYSSYDACIFDYVEITFGVFNWKYCGNGTDIQDYILCKKLDIRKLMSSRMVIDTTSLSALASSLQPSVLHSSYASVVSRPLEHEIVHHVWH